MRPPPLDPAHDLRDAWIRQAADFIHAQLDGLATAPAGGPDGAETSRLLAELPRGISEEPIGLTAALEHLGKAARLGLQPSHPGYLAYVPGGGLFATALASFISLSLNRYTGISACSPALARLESDVLAFLSREVGLPAGSAGVLTSGGSIANLSAVVTARVAYFGDGGDFSRARVYLSAEAHRSVAKALRLAGIPPANLTVVPHDASFRIDVAALRALISADRTRGLEPFLVVASAGTTNTGAIDPLQALAELCRAERLWLHADGAYGGMFSLVAEGKRRLAGLERADSITLDPHKGLFLPYSCGCLLVARGEALHRAHSERGAYLRDLEEEGAGWSPCDLGPELSRNDRGSLVWLPLALHGASAFRAALEQKLELARTFRRGLDALPVELAVEPELSVVPFRLRRTPGETLEAWNRRNGAWLERTNARRRVHLSSTLLPAADGAAVTLRVCVLSFRTGPEQIAHALEDLAASL
jgi:aromatic-L-amino-acid decarboxylase